jgi:hypothetical protein
MLRDMLKLEGHEVGRKHVGTLMKKLDIQAIYRKANRGGSVNPGTRLSENSASMGDGNRLPRSRSNEKTPP